MACASAHFLDFWIMAIEGEFRHREYKVLRLLLTLLIFSTPAFADTVIFIGGFGSTAGNMACWKKGAEKQSSYSGYTFKTIKYPEGVTGFRNAINAQNSSSQINEIVTYINSRPNEKFVIAAHSSGSDIAFLAAKRLKNPRNVDYVNLAGWNVPRHMYRLNKVTSLKDPSSYGNCKSRPRWCRHFSLVNKTPPRDLDLGSLTEGYQGCNSNLSWLPKKTREPVMASDGQKPDAPPTLAPAKPKQNTPAFSSGTSGSFDDEPTPTKK